MKSFFLNFNSKMNLYWLSDDRLNTKHLIGAATKVMEARIVSPPIDVEDDMREYEIEQKGLGWRCVGTVSDVTGILGMVERDYEYQHTALLDIIFDMDSFLDTAAETAIRKDMKALLKRQGQ